MKSRPTKNLCMAFLLPFLMFSIIGCAALQSPIVETIFKIGVRGAVYRVAEANPSTVSTFLQFADTLSNIQSTVSAEALSKKLDIAIDEVAANSREQRDLEDIRDLIVSQYSQLLLRYGEQLQNSEVLRILEMISESILYGAQPSTDGASEFVLESGSLRIVVD